MLRVLLVSLALALAASTAFGQVVSGDGAWIAQPAEGGHLLVIADAETGAVVHRRALVPRDHVNTRVAALIALPKRRSFLVALANAPELWEIALFADAGPFHDGFVHSYETGMVESLAAEEGLFARRRIRIEAPVTALAPMPGKRHSVIATRVHGSQVEINAAVRREFPILPPG